MHETGRCFVVLTDPSGNGRTVVRCFLLTSGTSMSSTSIDFSDSDMPVLKWLCFEWSQDNECFSFKTDDKESNHAPISLGQDEVLACFLDYKVKASRDILSQRVSLASIMLVLIRLHMTAHHIKPSDSSYRCIECE
jgi:hypothetical protein